ncbi:MAG: ATP-dependent DNA helicase RecG [Muribaculaceae bacterium]
MLRLAKTDIKFLHGVGPKRAEMLAKQLDIRSYYDLLYYFPFRYVDKNKIHRICDIEGEMPYIQLKGRFLSFTVNGEGARRRLNALFSDGTGTIEVVWFNRVKQIQESYHTGVEYVIFGKPTEFNRHYSISHPEVEPYRPDAPQQGFRGVYTIPETLRNRSFTSRSLQQLVSTLISGLGRIEETLPVYLIERMKLMPIREALVNIHIPETVEKLQRAQFRLKFEELFYLQLNILKFARNRSMSIAGFRFSRVGESFNRFYREVLPFPLTGAQMRVIKEIRADMGSGRQMNRLLQGDVGSGKTLVALMTMLLAVDNGFQACLMAPTEILAGQHYKTISEMTARIGVRVELLTGSTKKRDREVIHEGLVNGDVKILIGTHALIEDTVNFKNLGMAVIDEQHRFGVAQRAKMWRKNVTPPHVLVMTATPIPRTLAMTVYGDLDVSVIDELPPGRKPIQTVLRYDNHRIQVYRFIGEQLKQGRQAYVVYPLIQESEKLDLRNLEEGYEVISEVFPQYRVCMVHGKMKPEEKDYQMKIFAEGKAQIMVATTVIEVGVNVPNASVMLIENAERFGLSQLHQLRGRVGRGADQAYCILMSNYKIARDTRHRLEVMTQTTDGFVVAEEDLKLRGPGDMEGTQQSGIAFDLRIANVTKDADVMQQAREIAGHILDADPQLTQQPNQMLLRQLQFLYHRQINWSLIS